MDPISQDQVSNETLSAEDISPDTVSMDTAVAETISEETVLQETVSQDAKELSFADLGLDEVTLKAIEAKGFVEPTPIQVLAIPRLLDGDANVIAKARTGTGKTAAFGLPLVQELRSDNGHPRALVLVPTRELAVQVANELDSLRSERFPRMVTVYGGASIVDQLKKLRSGVEIVVGTPGRVIDHLERGSLNLDKIEYFILDEADEMLNMGFVEDIEAIFGKANADARVLMFSATMPREILSIATNFMGDYEIVEEENPEEEPILTDQFWWPVREDDKTEALVRLIDSAEDFYGLVFCQTKADTDAVAKELDERHYQAAALHGDIAQSQREKILARFRAKKTRILVATDVAARGIDIEGLTHVVNYALPFDGPTYTHRIGRTGRAGASGTAVTFVRPEERRRLGYLSKHGRGELKEGSVPTVDKVLSLKRSRLMDATAGQVSRFFPAPEADRIDGSPQADADNDAIAVIDAEAAPDAIVGGDSLEETGHSETPKAAKHAKKAKLSAEIRAFADRLCEGRDPLEVLAAALSIQYGESLSPSQYNEIKPFRSHGEDRAHVRLYVGLGRRDGMTRRGIAQFFRDLIGVPERLVDRIDVLDAFSLATLPADAARAALDLSKQRRNVPHMHVDVRDQGGGFHAGPRDGRKGGRPGYGRPGGFGQGQYGPGPEGQGGEGFRGGYGGGRRFGGRDGGREGFAPRDRGPSEGRNFGPREGDAWQNRDGEGRKPGKGYGPRPTGVGAEGYRKKRTGKPDGRFAGDGDGFRQ